LEVTEVFVTTVDNPYDFFDEFDKWYSYDTTKGYNTCSLVDRLTNISQDASLADTNTEIERAVDKICKWNLTGLYKKISKTYMLDM
jgi:hypothetical protein